jgi:TolB-like protein/class 3 adenylate cyclase/Tfp pilus assembly protein PilF
VDALFAAPWRERRLRALIPVLARKVRDNSVTGERMQRRLAAVLAADVAGYSRLMGADEVGTLEALKSHRREVVDPAITEHRGRIVKTTGDGLLVEFSSAVDAVTCAMVVQSKMAERNQTFVPAIAFRIGINVGDIIIDADDIFGDGVNVAARVENECEPGGVCLSGSAFEQVRGKTDFTFDDLGEKSLKNIERPVRLYAARPAAPLEASQTDSSFKVKQPLQLPDKPSIAVLPFQNMSGDPEQEYFADGMVEDIITALSRIKWLFVIARNSSFAYKGKSIDIRQVGRELGVRYVLEGSVRKAGNRVRITGQLIEASTANHIWAEKFDSPLDDIFDLQDQVTTQVVATISPRLQQSELERANRKPTENLTAYDYYLRGFAKRHNSKREVFVEALPLLKMAIELDEGYAQAYAAIAFWYVLLITYGWSENREQENAEAVWFARKALELNTEDSLVLAQAGYTLAHIAGEFEDGADFLERAATADPNFAMAWYLRGLVNVFMGNYDEAIAQLERSLRLSPFDPVAFAAYNGLAYSNLFSGRNDKATEWAELSVRHNPNYLGSRRILLACYAASGNTEAAKAVWDVARRMDPTQRVSDIRKRYPLRRDEDVAKLVECFRMVGMPE